MSDKIRISCIADCHGHFPSDLPSGDLLILAGDYTARHTYHEFEYFVTWLNQQDYKKKIVIAGNHDSPLESDGAQLLKWAKDTEYLQDSGTEFEGLRIYGSPWSLTFPGINPKCTAFTGTEEELKEKFDLIPNDVNILITHSPPYGILDKTVRGEYVGSKMLKMKVLNFSPPIKYWIFGHIHESYGQAQMINKDASTIFMNCSHVDENYRPVNKPIHFEL